MLSDLPGDPGSRRRLASAEHFMTYPQETVATVGWDYGVISLKYNRRDWFIDPIGAPVVLISGPFS